MTWDNVNSDCMLCEMEKRTKWYNENEDFVIAEKLGGGLFIVIKEHKDEISDEELEDAKEIINNTFKGIEYDLRVLMNMVKNHWHAHIIPENKNIDLTGE